MGVRGLSSYIEDHAEYFLQNYILRDTFLVIDGSNLAYQLYWDYTKSNEAFGGDYDNYSYSVKRFFMSLIEYNVTPLIMLDGSHESRKTKTIFTRFNDRYHAAYANFPPTKFDNPYFHSLSPILLYTVFKNILKEMNIKYIQCLFEADNAIAGLAKLLGCPVLSFDSDFYFYGSLYIPFTKLQLIKKSNKWSKICSIYNIESLFSTFKGLASWKIPLAAMLIGNDYISSSEFDLWYNVTKKQQSRKSLYCKNKAQYRIQHIFQWLAQQKVENVINDIIKYIPLDKKLKVLREMEMIINEYSYIPEDVILQFNFNEETIATINSTKSKFEDANREYVIQTIRELIKKHENTKSSSFKDVHKAVINKLPDWFIDEFTKGHFSSYLMSLLVHRKYLYMAQIEDYDQPSSIFMSRNIINVIHTLLTTGFDKSKKNSYFLTRGPDKRIIEYPLKYLNDIGVDTIPSFVDLRKVPLNIRKCIYDNTLNIKPSDPVNKFPHNWRLYITVMKYWTEELSLSSNIHIYALLFSMLKSIIDLKIGVFRSIESFKLKFSKQLQALETVVHSEKNKINYFSIRNENINDTDLASQIEGIRLCPELYKGTTSIIELMNKITEADCLMLAPFFISYCEVNPKVKKNKKLYRPRIVHMYTQFQNCLRFSLDLNALLGCPYEPSNIFTSFNGTLIYNLYVSFDRRDNVEDYIKCKLMNSPNFLCFFNEILIQAKLLFKF
ncbi:hypothetical protein M0802_013943 [Mischocyttarus mexicanus]|nr:hypothetical protein M0802_013943 [Mischocyttarus mexicanus]